jgi:hypothetical protein
MEIKERHYAIIVNSDGETWSRVDGCSICVLTQEEMLDLENGKLKATQLRPIMELGIRNITL